MASIKKREGRSGTSYSVQIRKKGHFLTATFSDKETAEIWIKYNEDLIDNINNFNEIPENIVTLEQAIELKKKSLIKKSCDKRTISDFDAIAQEFQEILNEPIGKVTTEMLRDIVQEKLSGIVKRGGNRKNNTGHARLVSPVTVLRKMRILACVFSYMIENGANIINPAQFVVNQLKMSLVKKGEHNEDE